MKQIEDDEIEVLGTSSKKGFKRKWWIVSFVGILCAFLAGYFLYEQQENTQTGIVEAIPEEEENFRMTERSEVVGRTDSINDVALHIYALQNLKAELTLQLPNPEDSTVYFVLQAADVREDNQDILGDFVLEGKQLARGKRKTGYCAILDGKLHIGNSLNDEVKDYCIAQKGDFFRQYILVLEGEIQENRLKGKAMRRALAQQGKDFYIVTTQHRESLYDFSEALADMGFTNALYLVGGTSYGWYRLKDKVYELGKKEDAPLPNTSYLVFRKAGFTE